MTVRTNMLNLILVALLLTGCATTQSSFRVHPLLNEKLKKTQTVVMIPPKIEVYQISAGGVREKMDEWTETAKKNVAEAIKDELENRAGFVFSFLSTNSLSKEMQSNLKETQALFGVVKSSIRTHTYGPPEQRFSEKIENFDYSLGTEVTELSEQADVLLLVDGVNLLATGGRKAIQAGAVIVGLLTGVVALPQGTSSAISMALIDADSGFILWYNIKGGARDFRDPASVSILVKKLFVDFPID